MSEKSSGSAALVDKPIKDLELLSVIHKACVLSFFMSAIYCLYAIFVDDNDDLVNVMVSISYPFIFLLEIVFFHFKRMELLKVFLVLVIPIMLSAETLCVGGDFSQSSALLASLAVGYVFFSDKRQKMVLFAAINIIMYVGTLLFLKFYGTLFEPRDDAFDEIAVFLVAVAWLYLILNMHDREKNRLIYNLEQKNQSLLTTTQELERFTSIASHDLKSPLRSIVSFLGLIEREYSRGDTSNLLNHLNYAKNGATQMHYLIEGILELSRVNIETNPNMELADLNFLLNNAINNLHEDILEKNAVVRSAVLPQYYCSPIEIALLFQNLIQNGIKYNRSLKPTVEITTRQTRKHLKIVFTDNGIGIEEQYYEYVFEHFKRLHSSSQYVGTGLGLSLCRKIAIKHKGEILLQSEPGNGSTFTVILPLRPNKGVTE